MNFRRMSGVALSAALALGMSAGVASGQQDTGAKQDMQNAGHESKDAVRDTGHSVDKGTHKAYHKTKYHSKKAWHSTKYHTKKAAHKVHNTVDPDNPPPSN